MICLTQENIKKLKEAIQKNGGAEAFLTMEKKDRGEMLNKVFDSKLIADLVNNKMELAIETGRKKVIEKAFKEMFSPEVRKIKENISEERKALLAEKQTLEKEFAKSEKEITRKEKVAVGERLDIIKEKIDNTTDSRIADRILKDYEAGKTDYISGAFEKAFNTELTNSELDTLYNISEGLKELRKRPSNNIFGRPNIEYYQKLEELRKFFDAQKQINVLETITGNIPVGSLLWSVKSAFLNNFSNSISLSIETGVSRIKYLQLHVNNYDLVGEYVKYAQDVYLASGINVSRIIDSKDVDKDMDYLLPYGSLESMKADTRLQKIMKGWGTFYEKTIFSGRAFKENNENKAGKALRFASLGYSDASFSAYNFADEVISIANIRAKKEGAKDVKTRSREIALDIFAAATKTVDYRLMSMEQIEYHGFLLDSLETAKYRAEVAIFQDKNALNVGLMKVKDGLNKVIPDLSVGTNIALFVKTPANVWVLKSYRYTGIELFAQLVGAVHQKYKTGTIDPKTLDKLANSAARTTLSWSLGALVTALIINMKGDDDDDPLYSVSYNTASSDLRKIYTEKNIPYNSFRIGKYWFSADYFGGTSSIILNFLDREYNKNKDLTKLEKTGVFFKNALSGWESLPIISELWGASNYYQDVQKYQKTENEVMQDTFGYLADIASRPIKVGVITDLGKIIDDQKRQIDYGSGWTIPIQQIAQIMPVLSTLLEERYSFTGEKLKQPAALNQILFGARYGKEKDNLVVDELYRLARDSKNINVGIEGKRLNGYGVSNTLDEMGMPFAQKNITQAMINKHIFNAYTGLIIDKADEYKEMTDDAKVQELNKLVLDAVKGGLEEAQVLDAYNEFTDVKKEKEKEEKRIKLRK